MKTPIITVKNFSARKISNVMEISQALYGAIFIYSIVIGIILGVVYDVFRIQRITMESDNKYFTVIRDIIIFIEDIIFAIISAIFIAIMIFYVNNGQIRWFALFGTSIGFIIYYNTIGRIVILCSEKIIAFIRYCIRMIKNLVCRFLIKPVIKFVRFVIILSYVRYMKIKNKRYTATYTARTLRKASEGFL